jgi:hypothetical protein
MDDNLLSAGETGTDPALAGDARIAAAGVISKRPPNLPDKFWDERRGEIRLDALIKSYLDLERKLGGAQRIVPDRPDDYAISVRDDILTIDPAVNQRLHQAGFSQDQAQLVYDLACDHLLPMIGELAALFEADSQLERLERHFGGRDRWREMARQINAWGRSHLPRRVFETLATTFEGVITMHKMMTGGDEPGLIRENGGLAANPSDADLRTMMRDPRYWRDQDPAYVAKVREGFRRLYQD